MTEEIRQRTKEQKCICKRCDECFFYRWWPATDMAGKPIGMKRACGLEVTFVELRRLKGSIDGAQQAANETRNRVNEFGMACTETLKSISERAPTFLGLE